MIKKLLLTLFPTLFFLGMTQLSQPLQQFTTGLFLTLTVVFFFLSRQKPDAYHFIPYHYFKNGMMILAIVLLICAIYPIGGYLNEPLLMPHSQENAEAIVVLASGATRGGDPGYSGYQRVSHGLRLLQQNRAPKLVISTGYSNFNQHAEAAWVASYTRMFAADQARIKILVSKDIVTTATEADYIYKTLSQAGIKKILLVTSNGHIYRAALTFANKGFEVLPAPTHNTENIFYASDHYLQSFQAAVHEWVGLIYYSLRGYL